MSGHHSCYGKIIMQDKGKISSGRAVFLHMLLQKISMLLIYLYRDSMVGAAGEAVEWSIPNREDSPQMGVSWHLLQMPVIIISHM
jgi:hypothetical protein